jgi:hypothetical protein
MFHKHVAQEVPATLAHCEFDCRLGECSREEWEQCDRRIQLATQLEAQAIHQDTLK